METDVPVSTINPHSLKQFSCRICMSILRILPSLLMEAIVSMGFHFLLTTQSLNCGEEHGDVVLWLAFNALSTFSMFQ